MIDSRSMPYTMGGLKIYIDNNAMVDVVEDWENVRSKGRAKRRRKRGFEQNIIIRRFPKKQAYKIGDKIFMHQELYAEFLRKMDEDGRFIEQGSRITDDLSFRDRPESKSSEYNFGRDYFRHDTGFSPYLSRIYN